MAAAVEAARPFKDELAERGVLLIPLPIYTAEDGAVTPESVPLLAADLRCAKCEVCARNVKPIVHLLFLQLLVYSGRHLCTTKLSFGSIDVIGYNTQQLTCARCVLGGRLSLCD